MSVTTRRALPKESNGRGPDLTVADCHQDVKPFLLDYDIAGTSATVLLWDVLGSVEDPAAYDRARTCRLVALMCFARDCLDEAVRERFEYLTFASDLLPDAFSEAGAELLMALQRTSPPYSSSR